MQFTSPSFLLFSAALLLIYYLVPKKTQWLILLAASYLFYWKAGIEAFILILLTTATTYITTIRIAINNRKQKAILDGEYGNPVMMGGRICYVPKGLCDNEVFVPPKMIKEEFKARNRICMAMCLTLDIIILTICKACLIYPFRSFAEDGPLSFLTLGLPMAISFYMFQSMGYIIDVYRGTVQAEKNPLKLALFVSFFPQLLQGPISRFKNLSVQLTNPHSFDGKTVSFGLQRMLWGCFKKLVIADRISVAVAALKGPEYAGAAFLVLTIFYAVQIYADFTGGIDITMGLSQALGITLPENFIRPFFSKNIAEYWRRWHITLGAWMKDYIFYPISISKPILNLSKNVRKANKHIGKRLPVYIATVITWLCTGIWHGLTPNFAVWGLLNCLVIVVSEELTPLYEKFHGRFHVKETKWYECFEILRMFFLMNLIRACDLFPDVSEYFIQLGSLFTTFNYHILWDGTLMQLGLNTADYIIVFLGVLVMFAVSIGQERSGSIRQALCNAAPKIRYAAIFLLLLATLIFGQYGIGYDASNFIYNQF